MSPGWETVMFTPRISVHQEVKAEVALGGEREARRFG
jgi:hypothetical protein